MAEAPYTSQQYKLRASAPMPTQAGVLKLHTFGAEVYDIDNYSCTDSLPASSEFRGQGFGNDYMSARFSRIGDNTGQYFRGQITHAPEYIDEDELGFNY